MELDKTDNQQLIFSNSDNYKFESKQDNKIINNNYDENKSYKNKYTNSKTKGDINFEFCENSKTCSMKSLSCIFLLSFLMLFNNSNITNPFNKALVGFNDQLFNFSKGFNHILAKNDFLNDFILILGGLLEDITVTMGFVFFALVFKSWHMLFGLGFLYIFRGMIQNIYVMRIPADTTFKYPGFPSLFVPYMATNDYFFSGHVSLPTIVAYNFYLDNKKSLTIFCLFAAVYEAFMMIVVRGHYSIDLYAGFIFSAYACIISKHLCKYIDYSNFGLLGEQQEQRKNLDNEKNIVIEESLNGKNYNSSYKSLIEKEEIMNYLSDYSKKAFNCNNKDNQDEIIKNNSLNKENYKFKNDINIIL
jgi:hypothetical protein